VLKVHTQPIKRSSFGFNKGAKRKPKAPLVWRTGLSGVPPDMSGAPEDSNANSPPSGISRGTRAIIHQTVRCTPDSVRCAKKKRPQELASFGNLQRLVRYNSPDMSGVHRTVRCAPDCPVQLRSNGYLRANGYLRRIKCTRSARRSQACPYWHTGQ
jgi:hypothetical protein